MIKYDHTDITGFAYILILTIYDVCATIEGLTGGGWSELFIYMITLPVTSHLAIFIKSWLAVSRNQKIFTGYLVNSVIGLLSFGATTIIFTQAYFQGSAINILFFMFPILTLLSVLWLRVLWTAKRTE